MLIKVWRFCKAFCVAFFIFAKREPGATLFLLVVVPAAIFQMWAAAHESPQAAQARMEAEAADAIQYRVQAKEREEQARARQETTKALCRLKDICKQYAEVRQDCATAGNFNNCISVKMGDERFGEVANCANDGSIASVTSDNVPSRIDCLTN